MPKRIKISQPQTEDKVRVERDVRDGSKDYFIPHSQAKALYNAGKLDWDITNGCYIESNKER